MADDVTSVGKIQLDIEVSKSSVAKEMEGLNKVFSSGFKSTISGIGYQMSGFVKSTIGRMAESFKTFGQVGNSANKQVAQSTDDINSKIEQLTNQMESATNRAEIHRQKLLQLQAEYDRLSRAGLGDSDKGRSLIEKIATAEDRVRRYGDVSDRTRLKIEQLEQSMGSLGQATSNTSKGFKKAESGARKAGNSFKIMGDQAKKSTGKVGGFANMINSSFMRVLKRIFILNLIYKAIRGLINYMNGALKTNKDFVSSLNTIKTNLKVAFQPIYDFILPALNALMKAVAMVTTYVASAISVLFGKSYKQSFGAAKGIEKSKKAMDGFGSSAKKAQNTLMGFDEINQLDISDDEAGGGADGHEMEMPDLATIDMTGIEEFKNMLADLFKPFKEAWEKEGLNVINAVKYAFENIRDLIKAIGKSWMEVWKSGTGQAIVESVLRILQLIFNIIGDIAKAFKTAWETNNLGTKLLQTIANMILSILGLIEVMGISWREVWNNGTGVVTITHILNILQQVFELVGNIAESFRIAWETNNMGTKILQNIADALNIILGIFDDIGKSINNVWGQVGQKIVDIFMKMLEEASEIIKTFGDALKIAWDNGGKRLFEGLLKLAAKIVEVAGVIWNDFIVPIAKGLLDILGPAFGRALDFAGAMVEGIIWWLDVLLKGLDIIKTFAEKVIGFFAWLYDVIVGHSIVPDLVNEVTAWFGNLGKWVIEKVKALVDAVIKFFTDLWDGVMKKTVDTWNSITTFISTVTDAIKTIIDKFSKSFRNTWDKLWDGAKTVFSDVWNSLTGIVKGVINGIIGIVNKFIDFWNKIELKVPEVNIPFVGKVGGFSIGVPKLANIPMLAKGGIIDQPTLAMVGERGKEAVVPFEDSGFLEALTGSIVNALLQILPFFTGGQGNQNSLEDKEIIVNLEGMPLVRILLPLINDELTRLGYRTIYQLG